jgi:hypothetical protein
VAEGLWHPRVVALIVIDNGSRGYADILHLHAVSEHLAAEFLRETPKRSSSQRGTNRPTPSERQPYTTSASKAVILLPATVGPVPQPG